MSPFQFSGLGVLLSIKFMNFELNFWEDVPLLEVIIFTQGFLKIVNSLYYKHPQTRLPILYSYGHEKNYFWLFS